MPPTSLRPSGARVSVENSGLEVWLYDDASLAALRDSRALDFDHGNDPDAFRALARKGTFVGYSLYQDDSVEVEVHVGKPLTKRELSVARWLEPQTALLCLPTGKLCIESNDARRAGQDVTGAKGAMVDVPPGDYRLTLYRLDYEAIERDGIQWNGPQEILVLTPGGKASDAVDDLLPFELRRDLAWVGKYQIDGRRAQALAWFSDYWDTLIFNLDSAAAAKLDLTPGSYFRATIPAAGLTFTCAFSTSWPDAKKLPMPGGPPLEEYGFGAFTPMSEWNQQEALFCRREKAARRIEDAHLNQWLPATIELLEVQTAPQRPGRNLVPSKLDTMAHLFDPGFFCFAMDSLIPEFEDMDELSLSEALAIFDKKFAKLGAQPQGDFSWLESLQGPGRDQTEVQCRLYAGLPKSFAVLIVCEAFFQVLFLSEHTDHTWRGTGMADDFQRVLQAAGKTGVEIETVDEDLKSIFTAHKESLGDSGKPIAPAPTDAQQSVEAFSRFLAAALG